MIVMSCTVILQFTTGRAAYSQDHTIQGNEGKSEIIKEQLERAENFAAEFNNLTTVLDGLNSLRSSHPEVFDQFHLSDAVANYELLVKNLQAMDNDIVTAIKEKNFNIFLNGAISREIPMTAIDIATGRISKFIETDFNTKFATFGADELLKALAVKETDKTNELDYVTHICDAVNQFAWATLGYTIGGANGAKAFQQFGGVAATELRAWTQPFFNSAVMSLSNVKSQMIDNYYGAQIRRIHDGQTVLDITDMYSWAQLKEAGFSVDEILRFNENAENSSIRILKVKDDISQNILKKLLQGPAKVGGVMINPKIDYWKAAPNSLSIAIKKQRPSQKSLYWDVKPAGTKH